MMSGRVKGFFFSIASIIDNRTNNMIALFMETYDTLRRDPVLLVDQTILFTDDTASVTPGRFIAYFTNIAWKRQQIR